MKRIILAALMCALLGFTAVASAQTPVTTASKIAWDQQAPSLAEAQAYAYKYYADGAATGVALTGVVCTSITAPTGGVVPQCEAPFPAFTPGSHSLALTAANDAGESVKSAPISFVVVVIPAAPNNLRIK